MSENTCFTTPEKAFSPAGSSDRNQWRLVTRLLVLPPIASPATVPASQVAPPNLQPEAELIEFLKNWGTQGRTYGARQYLEQVLPYIATDKPMSALDVFSRSEAGVIWTAAKQEHKDLVKAHDVNAGELEKAVASNRFFGYQKKDTPEITRLKARIKRSDDEMDRKAELILLCEARWKLEEPDCQRKADAENAKIVQAKRFLPHIESGKAFLNQEDQERKRQLRQEKERVRALSPQRNITRKTKEEPDLSR